MAQDGKKLIYDILINDPVIRGYVYSERDGLRINFYEYPETADMEGSWIIIESIINGLPSNRADDTWVAYDYLMHIEVWSRNDQENQVIANRIRDLLWEKLRFMENDKTDERDMGIYREARRYKGTLERSDLVNS